MIKKLFFILLIIPFKLFATLSIVAVDPLTGKVGSAGFTCICNFDLRNKIALLVPGKGAFNAQAGRILTYFPNAKNYLASGYNAFEAINANLADLQEVNYSQILTTTLNSGAGGNIVDSPSAFAFTGNGNGNVNYYRYGKNFAIAGNILISKAVLDDAYNAFLNTPGELEDKLMAALMAAKRPGSDSRCLSSGISSHVAYIAVAKPTNPFNQGFLELQYINPCDVNKEPVDVLYSMFENWKQNNGQPIVIPKLNITSIKNNRQDTGDKGYTLDGSYMTDTRTKLLSPGNFGLYGTSKFKVNISDAFENQGSITQTALNGLSTDLFFIGAFNKTSLGTTKGFTSNEINEAYNWSLSPNKTVFIFESGGEVNSFCSKWGYTITQEIANPNTQFEANKNLEISNKIFKGPFGNVSGFQQGGSIQGYFSSMPSASIVLAVNKSNKPVLVYDCATQDILCSDTDMITSLGTISSGGYINNDNDRLLANLINLVSEIKNNQIASPNCNGTNKSSILSNIENETNVSKTEKINIYPNPANGKFMIDLSSFKNQSIKISLYNQNHNLLYFKNVKKIESEKPVEINAGELPEGVLYIVIDTDEMKGITKKIIIRH